MQTRLLGNPFSEEASSNPDSKGKEQGLLLVFGQLAHVGVDLGAGSIAGPLVPVFLAFGVIHRRRSNRCPRSVEITLEDCPKSGLAICQEGDWGRGNDKLK
jgi:hypothetical protein